MWRRTFIHVALLLGSLYTPAAFSESGRVLLGPGSQDFLAPLTAQATTFTMLPSVLSSTLSPYGIGPQRLQTSASCVLYPYGIIVPNCNITIRWTARNGSGGHVHNTNRPPGIFETTNGARGGSTDQGSPGSVTDNSGTTGALNVTYTSPEASGVMDLTVTGEALVDGRSTRFGPDDYTIGVRFDGLQLAVVAGLEIATDSNMHGHNNGHATEAMVGALGSMAQEFVDGLTQLDRPVPAVRVNALSLPEGGLFDYRSEWRPPHASHRFGSDADIRIWNLSQLHRRVLAAALSSAGFGTPAPNERPGDPGSSHWHLRLGQ